MNGNQYYTSQKKGYGGAALIVGILSILFFPLVGMAPLLLSLLSIIAIILGALSVSSSRKGLAIAGIVLGSLSLLIQVPIYISFASRIISS